MATYPVPTFGSNGALWSLSYEFWYYLAFPVLVLLLAHEPVLEDARPSRAWVFWPGDGLSDRVSLLLGITWLMGALITFLPAFPARRPWTRRLAIVLALAVFGAGLVLSKLLDSLSADLVLGLAVTAMIWVTLKCATAPLPAFYVHAARRAAHSSYTLYLVHLPLLIFLKATLHLPRAYPGWHVYLVAAGVLAAILLYAQLVYEAFEKNTDRVRRWIRPYVMSQRAA